MADLVRALKEELTANDVDLGRLTSELRRIEERLRLATERADKIKALLALYETDDQDENIRQEPLFHPTERSDQNIMPARPYPSVSAMADRVLLKSKAFMIKAAVVNFLNETGTQHRADILAMLTSRGLMGHEKNPMGSLAAYLSENKDTFVTDGKGNFSLRSPTQNELANRSLLRTPIGELVSEGFEASDTQVDQATREVA